MRKSFLLVIGLVVGGAAGYFVGFDAGKKHILAELPIIYKQQK